MNAAEGLDRVIGGERIAGSGDTNHSEIGHDAQRTFGRRNSLIGRQQPRGDAGPLLDAVEVAAAEGAGNVALRRHRQMQP